MFLILKTDYFNCDCPTKETHIYTAEKTLKNVQNWEFLSLEKRQYLPHYWSDDSFKGNVWNQALTSLHGGSLQITRTVPIIYN